MKKNLHCDGHEMHSKIDYSIIQPKGTGFTLASYYQPDKLELWQCRKNNMAHDSISYLIH